MCSTLARRIYPPRQPIQDMYKRAGHWMPSLENWGWCGDCVVPCTCMQESLLHTSHAFLPSCTVHVGLKVRLKSDTTSSCRCFDYVPGPFNASLHPIPWVDLTTAEATFQHIRLHELNNEDSLSFFMFTMASVAATMGIILINSENNYTLSKEFQSEEQGSQVSVVMVTKETGKELLKLARENIREIEAMVELPPGMKTEGVSTPLSPLPWTGTLIHVLKSRPVIA